MVLFASNIMDPLTVGSFLLILMQPNNMKYQRSNLLHIKVKKEKLKCKTNTNLYSILPVVGSKITHRSFHFLSCYNAHNLISYAINDFLNSQILKWQFKHKIILMSVQNQHTAVQSSSQTLVYPLHPTKIFFFSITMSVNLRKPEEIRANYQLQIPIEHF